MKYLCMYYCTHSENIHTKLSNAKGLHFHYVYSITIDTYYTLPGSSIYGITTLCHNVHIYNHN